MHIRRASIFLILGLAALLAGLNLLAFRYFLYWRLRWFDSPMHFLGGVVVASLALWLITFEMPLFAKLNRAVLVMLAVLVVGIAWEIFEYTSGITRGEPGYWFDTIHDVVFDLLGGASVYLISLRYAR